MNSSDEDAKKWIKIFTTLNQEEIGNIQSDRDKNPHLRLLQKALAEQITSRVHSAEAYNQSVRVSDILFGKNTADKIKEITEEEFLMVCEGVDQYKVSKSTLSNGLDPINLLTDVSGAFQSKGMFQKSSSKAFARPSAWLIMPCMPSVNNNPFNLDINYYIAFI